MPFCRSRCHFCAFYLEIHDKAKAASYVRALTHEIALHRANRTFGDQPITSLYVGGGTPTTLSTEQLQSILVLIRDSFALAPQAEISIEAHPDTVTPAILSELVEAGFNRISLGAESMEKAELIRVGRPGSPMGTARAVAAARQAGFANINLDLMYGLPGQTAASWHASLQDIIALNPSHVSCYALTVEEDTRLEDAIRAGMVSAPDADLQNELEELAEQELIKAGFRRYEISNYHRDDSQCRHNLLYWTGGSYLGLGPGAQSYVEHARYGNVADLEEYAELLDAGEFPHTEIEHLSSIQCVREAVIFGLRKTAGIPVDLLYGDTSPDWALTVHRLIQENYLERSEQTVRLTARGRRYADEVSVQLS
ncbi:MAG TPA: radical SAM family heme chaperone HemW [Nitrospiraceae bacterium]|nr:radical SAM family heme chaperone HemW [Nitrospiraceae bacterium]